MKVDNVKDFLPGIFITFVIAIPAIILGTKFPLVGGPVFAIVFGMLLGIFLKPKSKEEKGLNFASKQLLQYAVILLGFGLSILEVTKVGLTSLPIIISTILTALIVSYFFSRKLNIERKTAILIGVGSSICGGSAIAATAPVIKAKDKTIAQAISVIFFYNILAALFFPVLGRVLGFSNEGFALFAGTAINDTSSVTAASSSWDQYFNTGTMVLDMATIVKLTRTLAILPITLVLGIMENKNEKSRKRAKIPRFIVYFLLASILTTIIDVAHVKGVLSESLFLGFSNIFHFLKKLSKYFIIFAMAAIGYKSDVLHLIKTGTRPLCLGGICWFSITIVSILLQKFLGLY